MLNCGVTQFRKEPLMSPNDFLPQRVKSTLMMATAVNWGENCVKYSFQRRYANSNFNKFIFNKGGRQKSTRKLLNKKCDLIWNRRVTLSICLKPFNSAKGAKVRPIQVKVKKCLNSTYQGSCRELQRKGMYLKILFAQFSEIGLRISKEFSRKTFTMF